MRAVVLSLVASLAAAACTPQPRVFNDTLVEVPAVVGARVADAVEELQDGGFLVEVVAEATGQPAECPDGTVTAQDPDGSEEVLKATTVRLTATGCRP